MFNIPVGIEYVLPPPPVSPDIPAVGSVMPYKKPRNRKDRDKEDRRNYYSRVISNQVRFGYGYRTYLSEKQYFAWHGYPNRNDDYITYAEISGKEFDRIGMEYPKDLDADRETAEIFRKKYIDGHKILVEGWNVILPAETETV